MVTYLNTFRLFSRDIRFFLLSAFLNVFGVIGVLGVLFNLYLVRLGYGTEQIGLVLGIAELTHAAFCLPAGALGTRWGNRRMMISGQLVVAVSIALVTMTELIPASVQLAWINVAYACAWIGGTLYIVNVGPFLMTACEPSVRGHVFAMRGALSPIAVVAGSLVAGWLPGFLARYAGTTPDDPSVYGYPLLIVSGTLCIAAFLLSNAKGQHESVAQTEAATPTTSAIPYTVFAVMSIIALLRAMGEGAGRTFFNVYLDTTLLMPTAAIGTLIAIGQVLALPVSLAMPLIVQRRGLEATTLIGTWGVAICLLPMALFPEGMALSLGYMGLTAFYYLNQPVFIMYTQGAVSPHWRSFMSAAMTMAAAVGVALVSMLGGTIIAVQGYSSLWLWASFLTACGALLLVGYQRYLRNRPQAAVPPA